MAHFDTKTLDALRTAQEITVRTHQHPEQAVPVWVVVADDAVFVRSAYGRKGRWYRDLATNGIAAISMAGRELHAQAIPENGADANAATFLIFATLVAFTGGVVVGITDDDAAFAAFTPAAAVLVADHAYVLDVAVHAHRRVDGERGGHSGGGE